MNQHEQDYANAILEQMYLQALMQFGDAIKSYWFNSSDFCPGCGNKVGVVKYKGKDSLSLNAYIYRKRGVLIGYLLCDRCMKGVFQTAKAKKKHSARHGNIERNLVKAYHDHMNSMDA